MDIVTFRKRVLNELKKCAKEYSKLIGFDFIIQSNKFVNRDQYVIRCYEGNFLHLTGVKTNLKAVDFFKKCFEGTITEFDFDCDSSIEIKGTVRHKISNLLQIGSFFERVIICQELFAKGRVFCLLASSDGMCTLGFTGGKGSLNPHTLLNKNQINLSEGITDLIIQKHKR